MTLEEEDIREFAELWKAEFREVLSPDEARHSASQLLDLYLLLAEDRHESEVGSTQVSSESHHP